MALTSMQLSAEEIKEKYSNDPVEQAKDAPRYPYGLCIYLCDDDLQKLGLTSMPDVGTKMTLNAIVEVTSNSQRQTQDGKTSSMDLQITDMAFGPAPGKTAAQNLYSASDMNP